MNQKMKIEFQLEKRGENGLERLKTARNWKMCSCEQRGFSSKKKTRFLAEFGLSFTSFSAIFSQIQAIFSKITFKNHENFYKKHKKNHLKSKSINSENVSIISQIF